MKRLRVSATPKTGVAKKTIKGRGRFPWSKNTMEGERGRGRKNQGGSQRRPAGWITRIWPGNKTQSREDAA